MASTRTRRTRSAAEEGPAASSFAPVTAGTGRIATAAGAEQTDGADGTPTYGTPTYGPQRSAQTTAGQPFWIGTRRYGPY